MSTMTPRIARVLIFCLGLAQVGSDSSASAQSSCGFTGRWDQLNDSAVSGGYDIPGQAALGQELVPTTSSLDAVELMMSAQAAGGGEAVVQIREASITGRILGVSDTVSTTVVGAPISRRRFTFAQPVPLTPGTVHVIEVVHVDGSSLDVFLTGSGSDTYAGGAALVAGAAVPGDDLWFRAGASTDPIALPDQTNEFPAAGGWNLQSLATIGQEFTPTVSSLDIVELMMNGQGGSGGQAFVQIREASIAGSILGVSDTVSTTATGSPASLRRFTFADSVPLTPGAIHVIEVVHAGGAGLAVFLTGFGANTYPGGRGIVAGLPAPDDDLWFREGSTADPMIAPDQTNESPTGGGWVLPGLSVGQEFTPTASSLDVVELLMNAQAQAGGQAFVQIRAASITGTILGVSDTVSTTVTGLNLSRRRFTFPQPVPLTPGAIHVIEVFHAGGPSVAVFASSPGSNPYPGGAAIRGGALVPDVDLWFREGSSCDPLAFVGQSNEVVFGGGWSIPVSSPLGQEFTPTTTSLDVLELMMNAQGAGGGQAFVQIREASITGTVLGVSETVSIYGTGYPISLRGFTFAQPVPLTPGTTHVLEVVHAGGASVAVFFTGGGINPYAGGRAILSGAPSALDDFWFREGLRAHFAPPASCTFRNGTGVNPADYTCTTPPILGTDWQSSIATTPNTLATFIILSPGGPHPGLPLFGGELLIQPFPSPIFVPGAGAFSISMPGDPAAAGARFATQGLRVDDIAGTPTIVLLNALDLTLGL